jgi:hypothetical protein
MEDQRMTDLLRALPGERASEDFNERLLARLDTPLPARSGGARWIGLAGATGVALLLLVPLSGKLLPSRRVEPGEARLLLNQIQTEHRQLERELQALRRLQSEQPEPVQPVLYLGGDDNVDYVVDLEQVRPARSDRYNL